jgi:hypothetical protein
MSMLSRLPADLQPLFKCWQTGMKFYCIARSEHQSQLCPILINQLQYLNWSCNYWPDENQNVARRSSITNVSQQLDWNVNAEQATSRLAAFVQMLAHWGRCILFYIALQGLSVNCKSAQKLQTPSGHTSAAPISWWSRCSSIDLPSFGHGLMMVQITPLDVVT